MSILVIHGVDRDTLSFNVRYSVPRPVHTNESLRIRSLAYLNLVFVQIRPVEEFNDADSEDVGT